MTKIQKRRYYRCRVHEDQAAAVLRSRRCRVDALVQEMSIDGFTVLLRVEDVEQLAAGRAWVLEYAGATIEVEGEWFLNAHEGSVQIGLRRLRDLTRLENNSRPFFSRWKSTPIRGAGHCGLICSGLLLCLFLVLALPSVGDALGTAPKIESAVLSIWSGLSNLVRGMK